MSKAEVEARHVTAARGETHSYRVSDSTTLYEQAWDEISGKNDPAERFRLLRLCPCEACEGTGKAQAGLFVSSTGERCPECRGEGRTLQLVATAPTPEALGTALVTLAREGEFSECPIGLLDLGGEPGERWLVRPWGPSPRNTSDAGKLLRSVQTKGKP